MDVIFIINNTGLRSLIKNFSQISLYKILHRFEFIKFINIMQRNVTFRWNHERGIIDYHFSWLHYRCIAHPHHFLSRRKIERHCRRLWFMGFTLFSTFAYFIGHFARNAIDFWTNKCTHFHLHNVNGARRQFCLAVAPMNFDRYGS